VTDVVQDIRTAKKNEDPLKDSKEEEDVLMDRRTVKGQCIEGQKDSKDE
jgi:hypothetical protein